MHIAQSTCWLWLTMPPPCYMPACKQWIRHACERERLRIRSKSLFKSVCSKVLVVSHKREAERRSPPLLFMIHEWLIFHVSPSQTIYFIFHLLSMHQLGFCGTTPLVNSVREDYSYAALVLFCCSLKCLCLTNFLPATLSWVSGQQTTDMPEKLYKLFSFCCTLSVKSNTVAMEKVETIQYRYSQKDLAFRLARDLVEDNGAISNQ